MKENQCKGKGSCKGCSGGGCHDNKVEVVRCKDCKWWVKLADSLQGQCGLLGHYPTGYWYCANGERNENA